MAALLCFAQHRYTFAVVTNVPRPVKRTVSSCLMAKRKTKSLPKNEELSASLTPISQMCIAGDTFSDIAMEIFLSHGTNVFIVFERQRDRSSLLKYLKESGISKDVYIKSAFCGRRSIADKSSVKKTGNSDPQQLAGEIGNFEYLMQLNVLGEEVTMI